MPAKKRCGRIMLIHGAKFRQKDKDNLRKLAVGFRAAGFTVVLPTYGYIPAIMLGLFQWLDRRVADTMASFVREDDVLLGHSNGATLVYLVCKRVHVKGAILINAALDSSRTPDAAFVHVYHNKGDVLTRLSALFPFHPWGDMGGVGYTGTDPRVTNFDQGNPPAGLPKLDGHSDIFQPGKTRLWSHFMAAKCVEALGKLKAADWSHHHD